ncbi:hypothetical protein QVD17_03260 [Tagetes erecta]|uniref:Uncharacterized protein n=1 Tax=Tagetes erecta TaxID=13708 RepID=A0AAD8LAZ2_TARER|nr:hypothetical protein QVD17_03260 [Tagetes erecta]
MLSFKNQIKVYVADSVNEPSIYNDYKTFFTYFLLNLQIQVVNHCCTRLIRCICHRCCKIETYHVVL